MPIEAKDILTVIGTEDLSKYEKVEDFKADFEKKFVSRDLVHDDEAIVGAIAGKINGPYESLIKKEFKALGVEFDTGETKGLKLPELVRKGIEKSYGPMKEELETLRAGAGGDEALKKSLEKERTKAEKLATELGTYKSNNEQLSKQIEDLNKGFEDKQKNWMLDQHRGSLYGKVKFKTAGLPEETVNLMKDGFINKFEKSHKLDLDEKGNLVVLTAEGKPVTDKTVSGKVLTAEEAIKQFAVEQKVWEDSAAAGKTIKTGNGFANHKPDNQQQRQVKSATLRPS